jgi:hypothetical protein
MNPDDDDPEDLICHPQPEELANAGRVSTKTRTFILRLWLENAQENGRMTWRGQITHVLTRKKQYVKSLEEIDEYIRLHLQEMGAGIEPAVKPASMKCDRGGSSGEPDNPSS